MKINKDMETTVYAVVGLMLVVAMFAFIISTGGIGPTTVYGGSIGENMSKYSCLKNKDMCNFINTKINGVYNGI